MIQDILPKKFCNEFSKKSLNDRSFIMFFSEKGLMCEKNDKNIFFPRYKDIEIDEEKLDYAFSIDNDDYFVGNAYKEYSGFEFVKIPDLRYCLPKCNAFAGITAHHIFSWYRDTKFCGRCGEKMKKSGFERAMVCEKCGNTVYPKLCPAVIVAVTHGDSIILTKYAGREYKNYALVAGFAEFGETIEETVSREVMEEVGISVKNIRYYKSQPWALSSSLLLGFFAEADGNTKITRDASELKEAQWFKREDMPVADDGISLTREMMMVFKNGSPF